MQFNSASNEGLRAAFLFLTRLPISGKAQGFKSRGSHLLSKLRGSQYSGLCNRYHKQQLRQQGKSLGIKVVLTRQGKSINSIPYSLASFWSYSFPIFFKTYLPVPCLKYSGPAQHQTFTSTWNVSHGWPSDPDHNVKDTGPLLPHISA